METLKCVQILQVNLLLNLPLLIKLSYPFHRLFKSDSYIYFFLSFNFLSNLLIFYLSHLFVNMSFWQLLKAVIFNISDDLHISTRQISWYLKIGFLCFLVFPNLNYYWNYCKEKKEGKHKGKERKGNGGEGKRGEGKERSQAEHLYSRSLRW